MHELFLQQTELPRGAVRVQVSGLNTLFMTDAPPHSDDGISELPSYDQVMGGAIRCVRDARGMTQQELAGASNLSVNYISLLETGRRGLSDHALRRIARALKVPILWIQILAAPVQDKTEVQIGHAIDNVRGAILKYLQAEVSVSALPSSNSHESQGDAQATLRELEIIVQRLKRQLGK